MSCIVMQLTSCPWNSLLTYTIKILTIHWPPWICMIPQYIITDTEVIKIHMMTIKNTSPKEWENKCRGFNPHLYLWRAYLAVNSRSWALLPRRITLRLVLIPLLHTSGLPGLALPLCLRERPSFCPTKTCLTV